MTSLSARVVSLEEMQTLFDKCSEGFQLVASKPQGSTFSFHLPVEYWDEFLELMEKVRGEVTRQLMTLLSKVEGKDMTSLVKINMTKRHFMELQTHVEMKDFLVFPPNFIQPTSFIDKSTSSRVM